MVSEEMELNHVFALMAGGIEVVETDLGELIIPHSWMTIIRRIW